MTPQESTDTKDDGDRSGTVLIVDDEPSLVELFAASLEDQHTVRTANSGAEALEQISDDVDVLLLDRIMPGLTGDEVLREVRDQGYNCKVAMVTAVEPDLDLVDLPFDAYLTKPALPHELLDVVDELLLRSEYAQSVSDSLAIASKRATIATTVHDDTFDSHEGYQALVAEHDEIIENGESIVGELYEDVSAEVLYRDVLGTDTDN